MADILLIAPDGKLKTIILMDCICNSCTIISMKNAKRMGSRIQQF